MNPWGFVQVALALLLSPLLIGVINRTKAFVAGRRGTPLLQLYHDAAKLLRKGAVYSRTTTWVFRAGPIVALAATLGTLPFLPAGGLRAVLWFDGDLLVVIALLGVARFLTVLAALDTGSSFEGMGASREVTFSALAEPALLLGLAAMGREVGSLSLSDMSSGLTAAKWFQAAPAMMLAAAALLVVFLAENARVPVDDPNTHLELTMIHEVMVLDHGGPDFGVILYGSALKLWVLGTLLVNASLPVRTSSVAIDAAAFLAGMLALAVLTGLIESAMARLRLAHIPQLLVGATALSVLAIILVLR
ncbi:MAG: NADH-quinone oxidoreductase subunit H [Planctomycetes bacterium]|nr:NADH-quinone oxidoreductase subunit H [Planctomycetota bacterium]